MQLERGAHNDNGTARVVNALTEQVLTGAALLALEHVGQRLEGTVTGALDGTAATAVVEEGIHRLLKHALLVVHHRSREHRGQACA